MQPIAGLVGVAGLVSASALHVAWATGSTWPASDAADLADLVVGRSPSKDGAPTQTSNPMPATVATFAVAGLLGAAALLTAGAAGLIPVGADRGRRLARVGARVAAGALLARGGTGMVVSSLGIDRASERFRTWNRRLYSPLCLGLGSAVALSTGGR